MRDKTDTEYCSIMNTVCPYEQECWMCRLYNDYEDAVEKGPQDGGKSREGVRNDGTRSN